MVPDKNPPLEPKEIPAKRRKFSDMVMDNLDAEQKLREAEQATKEAQWKEDETRALMSKDAAFQDAHEEIWDELDTLLIRNELTDQTFSITVRLLEKYNHFWKYYNRKFAEHGLLKSDFWEKFLEFAARKNCIDVSDLEPTECKTNGDEMTMKFFINLPLGKKYNS